MPITAYAGVTGFTTRAEIAEALSVVPTGRTLMCGVLVSTKSLLGIRNKWYRRYPEVSLIHDIFMADKRVLNLLHVAFGRDFSTATLAALTTLVNQGQSGFKLLHGFQFNGAWPRNVDLDPLPPEAFPAGLRVVLQVRPVREAPSVALDEAISQACKANEIHRATDVLIDASGGRGEPIDVALADIYVRAFKQHAPRLHIGIAGGLCAREMPRVRGLVAEHDLSVDAEGQLRDGEEGGTLNIDAMKDYLKLAYQAQGAAS